MICAAKTKINDSEKYKELLRLKKKNRIRYQIKFMKFKIIFAGQNSLWTQK